MSLEQKKALPTKISILGREVDVQIKAMKPSEFGEYEQHEYLITINKKLSYEMARQTLFHEAIHAALHISGLSEVLPDLTNSMDVEEAVVVCLENAFSEIVDIDKLSLDRSEEIG